MQRSFLTHTTGDGRELRFAHLTLYDIFGDPKRKDRNGFVPQYRRRLKEQLIETLTDAGADMEQRIAELGAFDGEPIGMETFIEFLGTPTGRTEVLEYCWGLANEGDAGKRLPEMLPADWDVVRRTLFEAVGITFDVPVEEKQEKQGETPPADPLAMASYGDGGADPNPQTPLTYSAAGEIQGDGSTTSTSAA